MSNYVVSDTSLASVADAIRAKGGTTAALEYPEGFVQAISDIETGGGGGRVSMPSKDVDFIDYDGTIVYSYTAEEFLALSAMPENPDHSGDEVPLTAQGWNWTLADAQEQLRETGYVTIGQLYVAAESANMIVIEINEAMTLKIRSYAYVDSPVVVDWGDGSDPDVYAVTSTGTMYPQHSYSKPGRYNVSLTGGGSFLAMTGNKTNDYSPEKCMVIKAILGESTNTLQNSMYAHCYRMRSCINRREAINVRIRQYALANCYSLTHFTFNAINTNLKVFEGNVFQNDYALQSVSFPNGLWIIPQYTFCNCYALNRICVPSTVTKIDSYAFYNCYSLWTITIPSGVIQIGSYAFYNCKSMIAIHVRSNNPPTLSNSNAFSSISSDCKIYVPYSEDHSILAAYKAATNWSSYASKMQEEPQ